MAKQMLIHYRPKTKTLDLSGNYDLCFLLKCGQSLVVFVHRLCGLHQLLKKIGSFVHLFRLENLDLQ